MEKETEKPRLRRILPLVFVLGLLVGAGIGAAIGRGWIPVGVGIALAAMAGVSVGIVIAAVRGKSRKEGSP